jgi:hypothetical protein
MQLRHWECIIPEDDVFSYAVYVEGNIRQCSLDAFQSLQSCNHILINVAIKNANDTLLGMNVTRFSALDDVSS